MTEDQQPAENPSERVRKAFELEFERFSDSPETLSAAEDQLKKGKIPAVGNCRRPDDRQRGRFGGDD